MVTYKKILKVNDNINSLKQKNGTRVSFRLIKEMNGFKILFVHFFLVWYTEQRVKKLKTLKNR